MARFIFLLKKTKHLVHIMAPLILTHSFRINMEFSIKWMEEVVFFNSKEYLL